VEGTSGAVFWGSFRERPQETALTATDRLRPGEPRRVDSSAASPSGGARPQKGRTGLEKNDGDESPGRSAQSVAGARQFQAPVVIETRQEVFGSIRLG